MSTVIKTEQKLKSALLKMVHSKQFKKAEKLYSSHRNDPITDIEIWKLFSGVNYERKKLNEVVHCCTRALELEPTDIQTRYNCALAQQMTGDIGAALNNARACVDAGLSNFQIYALYGSLLQMVGDDAHAIEWLQRSIETQDNTELRLQIARSLRNLDRSEEAISIYTEVLASDTRNPRARFYLAQTYYDAKNYAQAEQEYVHYLEDHGDDIRVINNLGRLKEETGDTSSAVDYYRRALQMDDSIGMVHLNLGKALLKDGDRENAHGSLLKALELDENNPETHFNLGKLCSDTGDIDAARKHFNMALELDIPDTMEKKEEFIMAAKYFLASIESPDVFDDDKREFVADLFDEYADRFDDHLVNKLQYRTPDRIRDMLSSRLGTGHVGSIMDLGCGTGLCAHFLKPICNHLVGVDISGKMIDKARDLSLYDDLIVGEISEELGNQAVDFDVIVAADVYVYVGGLEQVFDTVSRKLKPGGFYIFSTERMEPENDAGFRLFDSGRYKHTDEYLNELAGRFGFNVLESVHCTLRKEHGNDVEGTVSLLTK